MRTLTDRIHPWTQPIPQENFNAWRWSDNGEEVVQLITELARKLVQRGFAHYGVKGLIETARWHYLIKHGPDMEGYKVNNNYAPYIARELVTRRIVPDDFFRFRKVTAR
jgi:hypothetical protein